MKTIMTSLALAASLSGAAWAQEAPMTVTRGTIGSVNGQALEAKSRNGQTVPVALTAKTKVLVAEAASLSDVKPNSYVGIAAAPQPDGTLKALEVTIFDESLRGSGDGHYGWDLPGGGNTMTNGAVGSVQTTNGRTLVLNYKGGSKTVVVPDDVPVVTIKPSDNSVLKPGARVVVFSPKGAASVTADALVAGANGTVPPM